jgi:DNA modification methylase
MMTEAHSALAAPCPLAVTHRRIDELKLNPRNPRRHDRRQIRQVARSIEAFGFNVPVLVDRNDRIVAGHGRVQAATSIGMSEVPTIRLEHLTDAQAKAFTIADNRLTDTSTWDERLLAETLQELSIQELDFTIEATGFTVGEIDLRIEGLNEEAEADPADAEVPAQGPPVSRPGDLWVLDRHRVLCGSALDAAAYPTLLQGEEAAMVFTDPPYNVPIGGHVSGLGAIRHREFAMASGEMTRQEFTAFLTEVATLLARHSAPGSLHYLCMDWRHLGELLAAGERVYDELKNICVWVKSNAGMGSFYRSQHELVLVFKHGTAPHRNNVDLGRHGRHRSNVWHYPSISSFGRGGEEGNLLALHPTVKPVKMVADAILDCTARGEAVLDPFLGSGTTVLAAERSKRRCFGIELDPLYVDTAIRRWQAYTGDVARHARSGQSFDEIAAKEATHV